MSQRFVTMSDATGDVLPKAATTADFTLLSSSWTDPVSPETYYTQTVTNISSLITSTTNGTITLQQDITNAQYEAAVKAQMRCSGQAAGSVTIKARKKPSVDIPCTIIILG